MFSNVIAAISGSLIFILFASGVAAQAFTYGPSNTVTGCSDCEGQTITIPGINSLDGTTPITTIGDYAFSGKKLTGVLIPDSVTTIEESAFADNKTLTSIIIPNSVNTIEESAFANAGLTSLTIPNQLTTIENGAFSENGSLTKVTIPDNVKTINAGAFAQSGLASVTIPGSVDAIQAGAFGDNASLISVTFEGDRPVIDVNAFIRISKKAKIYFRPGKSNWPGNNIAGITPAEKAAPNPGPGPGPVGPGPTATSVPTLPIALLMALPLFIASIVFKKRKQLGL